VICTFKMKKFTTPKEGRIVKHNELHVELRRHIRGRWRNKKKRFSLPGRPGWGQRGNDRGQEKKKRNWKKGVKMYVLRQTKKGET